MSSYATWQRTCATGDLIMIGLENDLERKKLCVFHMMVLKERK